MLLLLHGLFLLHLLLLPVQGSLFTVPHKLAMLFQQEKEVLVRLDMAATVYKSERLAQYISSCQPRLDELAVLDKFDQESEQNHLADIFDLLVGNPVHVYNLIDRLVNMLPDLRRELIGQPSTATIGESIHGLVEEVEWPTGQDMEGVAQALARIQFAYRLDPVQLASGEIMGVKTVAVLSAGQMMDIARSRYEGLGPLRPGLEQEFAIAVEWAEGALEVSKKMGDVGMELLVEDFLGEARHQHDIRWKSPFGDRGNLPNEEFFVTKIIEDNFIKSGKQLRAEEDNFLKMEPRNPAPGDGYNIHDFYSLCRGEKVNLSSSVLTNSRCFFTTKDDPYFLLAPLKLEILSEDPILHLYHNILTEEETQFLTSQVQDKLSVATVADNSVSDGSGGKVSIERTQASGWVWDQEHQLLYKLSKKTARLTKLDTFRPEELMVPGIKWQFVEAEAWQVGLYGPGGHYLPHFDAFDILDPQSVGPDGIWVGNRVATLMFYLSDVVGGATAFPKIGVAARPRKGSAVFWYNLHTDGLKDSRSLHGACPVVRGVKWVSNKWIREGAQIWRRPCV